MSRRGRHAGHARRRPPPPPLHVAHEEEMPPRAWPDSHLSPSDADPDDYYDYWQDQTSSPPDSSP